MYFTTNLRLYYELNDGGFTAYVKRSVEAIPMTVFSTGGVAGAIITILLVILLLSRELVNASSFRSKKTIATLDAFIIPLLLVFVALIVFQVLEIVHLF